MFSEQFQFSPENVAALQDLYNNSDFTAFCGTEDMVLETNQKIKKFCDGDPSTGYLFVGYRVHAVFIISRAVHPLP